MAKYTLLKQEGRARRGRFETVHGTIETPVFMNVGTSAAIKGGAKLIKKGMTSTISDIGGKQLKKLGADITEDGLSDIQNKAMQKSAQSGSKQAIDNLNNAPNLGRKLDYAFGKATGNAYNVTRSMQNVSQLSKIGIYDDINGRDILSKHFDDVFSSNSNTILSSSGRCEIYSLLSGPGGFLGVKTIWENNKLITFIFFGG